MAQSQIDGNTLVAKTLARAGVTHMFGVVGIPVTSLATRSVSFGIRFIAFHNEQSAGYAASAYGFLTGKPGILLTVSGPGCVHGLAGLSNASINAWPTVLISGSSDQSYSGRGDFQELDQLSLVAPFSKLSARPGTIVDVPGRVFDVLRRASSGRPGGTYLDLPADVLHQTISEVEADALIDSAEKKSSFAAARVPQAPAVTAARESAEARQVMEEAAREAAVTAARVPEVKAASESAVTVARVPEEARVSAAREVMEEAARGKEAAREAAVTAARVTEVTEARGEGEEARVTEVARVEEAVGAIRGAERPLIVVGKGAAYARAEKEVKKLIEMTGIPFLPTPMGKGMLPDNHELAATAARSLAIGKCDVAVVVGARLNWMLHFGEPPKWSKDVKFILIDICEDEIELRKPFLGLCGDAKTVLGMINEVIKDDPFCLGRDHPWVRSISSKVRENVGRMEAALGKEVVPFDFMTPMRIIRDAILGLGSPAPVLVSEGANTMDVGRAVLPQMEPRTRLDAGTWGTMGVGLGYCIAAAVACPERLVVAVEGDSGFGFSAMEVETLVRYQLPVVVIVFNNGGVYGGDRRTPEEIAGPHKDDPAPTSFVPEAKYHVMMEAFGGKGYMVKTPAELKSALDESFSARKPAVINVILDPYAGSESGRLQHKN